MKVVLYMATTVNSYIAKENGDCPWSDAVWDSYYTIAKQFKALILGSVTYEIMKNANEFEKIGDPFTVVVASKPVAKRAHVAFVTSPRDALKLLKEKGFAKVLVGGGGRVNASFMKEQLIDEVILDVEPLVFGKGIKLFADEEFETALELIEVKRLSGHTIQLRYKVKK